jgi:hypothetical protein
MAEPTRGCSMQGWFQFCVVNLPVQIMVSARLGKQAGLARLGFEQFTPPPRAPLRTRRGARRRQAAPGNAQGDSISCVVNHPRPHARWALGLCRSSRCRAGTMVTCRRLTISLA